MADEMEALEGDAGMSGMLGLIPLILWHRKWIAIVPAVLIAIGATAAAYLLPREYVSSAVLLVESEKLAGAAGSGGLAGSMDEVIDRRVARIREQLLSRPELVNLIQAHNLYDASSRNEPLSKLIDRMRDATEFKAVDTDVTGNSVTKADAGSIAFSLSFSYPHAVDAQIVEQAFVSRLLTLYAAETEAQIAQNVQFLQDQQTALQGQLDQVEGRINQITGSNGQALANAGGMGMLSIGGGDYESQIAALRRANAELQTQTGHTAVEADAGVLAAQTQLAAARAKYSDTHPDVKAAESLLAAARSRAAANQTTVVDNRVQEQIAVNNRSIADMSAAKATQQGRAATVAAAQSRGPEVLQQVNQLDAKASQIRTDLGKITSELMNARSMSKLNEDRQGERLTLVDPPVTPDNPSKPNRPLLIGLGIGGGLAFGLILALLFELLAHPIRSVAGLTRVTGEPPLGVVPVLSRKSPKRKRNRKAVQDEGAPA